MIMIEEDGLLPSSFSLFIHHSCSFLFEFGPIHPKVPNPKNPLHWFWLMGVVLRRHHRRFIPTLTIFALLLLLSPSSASSLNNFSEKFGRGAGLPGRVVDQKRLGRPGSAPPRCRLKCGNCEPCQAVHVRIEQGLITPLLEYYPEAWRCKCGEKTFMP